MLNAGHMRKLAWTTVGFTYLLMVWGNLVSATGSGLACPDWPLCHGTIAPGLRPEVILEWGHRLLAFTASCLIFTTIYKVLRTSHPDSVLRRSGMSMLGLLILQILLGATTVLLGLSPTVSTIHLVIANIVFGGLITVACVVTWGNPVVATPTAEAKSAASKLRLLALSALAGMIVQLALGALVRHTHSGLACSQFPNCLDQFLPIPLTFQTALAFLHRWWGFALMGLFFHMLGVAKEVPGLHRASGNAFKLALAQIFLGIGTVMTGLNTHTRASHAAIGYALWGTTFYIVIRSGGLRWLWDRTARVPQPVVEGHSVPV